MAWDFNNSAAKQFLALRDGLAPQLKPVIQAATQLPAGASAAPIAPQGDIDPDEWYIIKRESNGRVDARNPKAVISGGKNLGHAFGIGQLVDTNRQYYARLLGIKNPDTLDRNEQLAMFRAYVKNRYKTAANARRHKEQYGWY